MSAGAIFISAFIIGFSGAVMPGPMLGIVINGSMRKGYRAGPTVVLGHAALEFALIFTMLFGLKDFFSNTIVAGLIGVFGGAVLCWMGYGMVRSGIRERISLKDQGSQKAGIPNLVLAGIVISATNPYFILWWASTGMEQIRQAYVLGVAGVIIFYLGHILSDFVWYSAVSMAFSKGQKLLNDKVYQTLIILLGLFLFGYSLYFIYSGIHMLIKV